MNINIAVILTSLLVFTAYGKRNNDTTPERRRLVNGVDFSLFSAGDVVSDLGNGITVSVEKRTDAYDGPLTTGQAMIFDSSNPTGGDFDLGSPNTDFGGLGVGNAGKKNKLFRNAFPLGNVLIISQDENASDPNDNEYGGVFKFTFSPPRYVDSIGLLDNDEGTTFEIVTEDGGVSSTMNGNGGDNSYESVSIGKPAVVEITVYLNGSGAISDISTEATVCIPENLIDFSNSSAGDEITNQNGVSVSAKKIDGTPAIAMIFDTSNPTGGDFDLGTPHKNFGGPGIGKGGKKKSLFSNSEAKGNVLIISEDGDPSDPDDAKKGGTLTFEFSSPGFIDYIGLLDNDEGVIFDVFSADGSLTSFVNNSGGNNSFEFCKIGKPAVTKIDVHFLGSGAITEIIKCSSDA